jgi:hypothetical protein
MSNSFAIINASIHHRSAVTSSISASSMTQAWIRELGIAPYGGGINCAYAAADI